MRRLARSLAAYGDAIAPVAKAFAGPFAEFLSTPQRLLAVRTPSALETRDRLVRQLRSRDERIVVVIDDIDRLSLNEITEVLRLVKLVGNLPGVTYVLAYERDRVESAFTRLGPGDGAHFLEKIVQVPFAVPAASAEQLRGLMVLWLEDAVPRDRLVAFDQEAWAKMVDGEGFVSRHGITSYLRTVRDCRRFVNAVSLAVSAIGDEVATMDVLALEALRVFDPSVHDALPALAKVLVGDRDPFDGSSRWLGDNHSHTQLKAVLESANSPDAASSLLSQLFPGARFALGSRLQDDRPKDDYDARARRRVAARSTLERYLYAWLAPDVVSRADVDRAISALGSPISFREMLDGVDDSRLVDLLIRVGGRLDEAAEFDVVEIAVGVLSQRDRVPIVLSGIFTIDPLHRPMWFVDDLIATLRTAPARERAVESLLQRLPTLSLRSHVMSHYATDYVQFRRGARKRPELHVLDEDCLRREQVALARDICAADSASLAAERNLLALMMDLVRTPRLVETPSYA